MSHLFGQGFGKYLDTGDFSDLELVTERRTYKVHRLLLIYRSEYFAKLLTSGFKESKENSVVLQFKDPEDLFPQVLRFIYEDKIVITRNNAIPLLAIADHYLIDGLRTKAEEFICKMVHGKNVIYILQSCLNFNVPDVINKCIGIVATNFYRLQGVEDWKFLPPNIFYQLLCSEYLTIKDEYNLYISIKNYIKDHQNEVTNEQAQKLMECLRFSLMNCEELEELNQDPMTPKNIFNDALLLRIRQMERPEKLQSHVLLRPRPFKGKHFAYLESENPVEQRGIIHWLGMSCGKSKEYINPHHSGLVHVTASSLDFDSQEYSLVSLAREEICTKDVPASWICIDLGEYKKVLPSHYTLKHGKTHPHNLRTWDFQGSIDGRDWTTLKRHINDLSFSKEEKYQSCTWNIDSQVAYRKFRVLQTAHSSGNKNYLFLSGIELFGDIYEYKARNYLIQPHRPAYGW